MNVQSGNVQVPTKDAPITQGPIAAVVEVQDNDSVKMVQRV
jgi:hypothetical protein